MVHLQRTYIHTSLKTKIFGIELDKFEQEAIARHQNGEVIEEKLRDEWVIDIALERRSAKFIRYLLENGFKIRGGKKALIKSVTPDRSGSCIIEIIRAAEDHRYKVCSEAASLLLIEMSQFHLDESNYTIIQALDYLLEKAADLNFYHKGYYGTPLINAVFCESLFMVDYLLNAGSDPNGKCEKGSTPIMYAAGKCLPGGYIFVPSDRNLNILKLLLERGANPMLKLGKSQDAIYWAKSTGNKHGLKVLREHLGLPTETNAKERAREARDSREASVLQSLSADKSKIVKREVASNRSCPSEVLKSLMKDCDEEVYVRAYENYFHRFGSEQSLEQLVDLQVIETWYRDAEVFFDGEYRFEGRDIVWRKSEIVAKYSSNYAIHSTIVAYMRDKDKLESDMGGWIRAQFRDMVKNVWLLPDIQRAFIFEFNIGVENVMMNVTDSKIYKDYLQLKQPAGVRGRVIERLKHLAD